MKSFRKPCVARMEEPHKQATMQRHTISGEKSCVVTRGRTRRRETMQRHTFLIRKACVADRDQVRRRWFVQRHTISQGKPCIASTEREKNADVMQRHTLKMQFACINYDIQKNLCTFQIFLTCFFSSHFCFSLKVIPRQALPSAKKHEKDLSFMLVGRRRDSIPIEKGLYPRDNLSIHRCI